MRDVKWGVYVLPTGSAIADAVSQQACTVTDSKALS